MDIFHPGPLILRNAQLVIRYLGYQNKEFR